MREKTEIEQAKANAVKVVRAAIRLKHALAADEEINKRLPEAADEFDRRVAQGELPDPLTILAALDA